jgi:tryptophan synthase alpha chain
MSSARPVIEAARAEGRAALVGYLPAGYPTVDGSIRLMKVMADEGCDVIEVGLPYSDPVMDGPTIQAAADIALSQGLRITDVFGVVAASAANVPSLVMTYWNPVERYGVERFAGDLAAAGGSGLITPDLVPDEAQPWIEAADAHSLDKVFLVAPSSTAARLKSTTAACRGFVYATAVMGVTGARDQISVVAPELVARTREVTDLPIGLGLGVSTGQQAAEVAAFADAVIVGSAFVQAIADAPDIDTAVKAVATLTQDLAAGVRREL